MSQRVTCPHCEKGLLVPEELSAAVVVCPSCRGRFPNPERLEGTACELQESLALLAEPGPDGDYLSCLSGALLIFGLFGICLGFAGVVSVNDWTVRLAIVGALIWLGLMSAGVMMWQTRGHPEKRSAGRVLTGILVIVGILFLLGLALLAFGFIVGALAPDVLAPQLGDD